METRCVPLLGNDGLEKLKNSHIAVFGVGGVGGFVVEALARVGVGSITIVDNDTVNQSNINRQIIALNSTIGRKKVDVLKERILDINPNCNVYAYDTFVSKDTINDFDFTKFNYVADCVDNVTAKILIIEKAKENNCGIISSMGTGNKLDPKMFEIKDINQTSVCPLAKVMRYELKKRNITKVKVLFSKEEVKAHEDFVASVSFVPSVAGLLIAREITLDIINN